MGTSAVHMQHVDVCVCVRLCAQLYSALRHSDVMWCNVCKFFSRLLQQVSFPSLMRHSWVFSFERHRCHPLWHQLWWHWKKRLHCCCSGFTLRECRISIFSCAFFFSPWFQWFYPSSFLLHILLHTLILKADFHCVLNVFTLSSGHSSPFWIFVLFVWPMCEGKWFVTLGVAAVVYHVELRPIQNSNSHIIKAECQGRAILTLWRQESDDIKQMWVFDSCHWLCGLRSAPYS